MSKKQLVSIAAVVALGLSTGLTAVFSGQSIAEDYTQNDAQVETTGESLVDETTYVFTNADGSVRKIISSDWSKNIDGVDIYNKFNDEKTAPLDLKVTYTLDGAEVSASEIAGKSGRVTVKYAFSNNEKDGDFYVPYAVISGITLNNERFKNVEVKNAKLVNDGNRSVVAAVTLPGMQENLGVSSSKFEVPASFEFSADVTDFKLDMVVSVATSEVFSDIDTAGLENGSVSLENSLLELNSAMEQLISGSSELYDGLNTLYVKVSNDLAAGVQQLIDGSAILADGLNNGVATLPAYSTQVNAGLDRIIQGVLDGVNAKFTAANIPVTVTFENYSIYASMIAGVDANTGALLDGLFTYRTGLQTYTGTVDAKIAEAAAGATQLNAGLNQLNNQLPELTGGVAQLRDGVGQLNNGLNTFNEQGVQRLINIYNGNVKDLVARMKTIVEISQNHSNARYIYRVNEVK